MPRHRALRRVRNSIRTARKDGGGVAVPEVTRCFVERDDAVRRCVVSTDARVEGALEGSIVSPGVQVGAGGPVTDSVLLAGPRVPPDTRLHRSIVLEDGTVHAVSAESEAQAGLASTGGVLL